jgi:UDP-glucose 4-epimerase
MALEKLAKSEKNIECYNLGTGEGYSVYEVLKGFEKAMGQPIKSSVAPRRFGDVPKLLANIDKASQ